MNVLGPVGKWEAGGLQNRYEWVRFPPGPHHDKKYPLMGVFYFPIHGVSAIEKCQKFCTIRWYQFLESCPDDGMVDMRDLKSLDLKSRAGSSPAPGTSQKSATIGAFLTLMK